MGAPGDGRERSYHAPCLGSFLIKRGFAESEPAEIVEVGAPKLEMMRTMKVICELPSALPKYFSNDIQSPDFQELGMMRTN